MAEIEKKKILFKNIIILVLVMAIISALMIVLYKAEQKNNIIRNPTSEQIYYNKLLEIEPKDSTTEYIIEHYNEYPLDIIKMYLNDRESWRDFTYNYPVHKNDYQNFSYTDEELNGTAPKLYQKDVRWCYEKLGDNVYIASLGCMPTSLTMAYIGLTGKTDLDPKKISSMLMENGFGGIGGINIDSAEWFCKQNNFSCTRYDYRDDAEKMPTKDLLTSILNNGHFIIVSCRIGVFTGSGHAILISGYDEISDTFSVNDPANPENSSKNWSYEELAPELETIWDVGNI